MIIIKSKFSQIILIFSKVYAPHFVSCFWWRMLALHLEIVGVCPLVCGRCAVNIKLPLSSPSQETGCVGSSQWAAISRLPGQCSCSASGQLYPGLLCSAPRHCWWNLNMRNIRKDSRMLRRKTKFPSFCLPSEQFADLPYFPFYSGTRQLFPPPPLPALTCNLNRYDELIC